MKRVLFICLMITASVSLNAERNKAETVRFYVSNEGKDTDKGTEKRPWGTVSGACANVQAYMTDHPGTPVVLQFCAGEYEITNSIEFIGLKSPLALTSAPGQNVVFKGDVPIRGWKKVSDAKALSRIPSTAIPYVLEADLKENGVEDFGSVVNMNGRVDLYCKGSRQTLARWPDKGFSNSGKAVGATELEETWIHVHGTKEGVLEYMDDRISGWIDEDEPCLFGYWYWDWMDHFYRIDSVDKEKKVMTLKKPWDMYGFRDSCRFYGMNLLCELDGPGEYYIDRNGGKLFWYAPEEFKDDEVSLSVFDGKFFITVEDCDDFMISGIEMRGGRNGALSIKSGNRNIVSDCRLSCFGFTAIDINGGFDHKIDGCLFDELGCGGVKMKGGDRKSLTPSGFEFINSIVDNFSLFKRTYMPAVYFDGVGLKISHSVFKNSSSSALRLEGNDVDVSYCQFIDLVTESDDQGASDTYLNYTYRRQVFRYNYWKDINGGMFAGAGAIRFDDNISGNIVYGNVFDNCGGGNAQFGGVQINKGRDNFIGNNIFYHCPFAIAGSSAVGDDWEKSMRESLSLVDAVDGFGELYFLKYPELRSHAFVSEGYNSVFDNIIVGSPRVVNDQSRFHMVNNTLLEKDEKTLEYYLDEGVLEKYGLRPIPFSEIVLGPNRFGESYR